MKSTNAGPRVCDSALERVLLQDRIVPHSPFAFFLDFQNVEKFLASADKFPD